MDADLYFLTFVVLQFHVFQIRSDQFFRSACCNMSDGLSHDELRAVLSAQIEIVHRISSLTIITVEKRNGSRQASDAFQS